jgi:hypothetical protein
MSATFLSITQATVSPVGVVICEKSPDGTVSNLEIMEAPLKWLTDYIFELNKIKGVVEELFNVTLLVLKNLYSQIKIFADWIDHQLVDS